MQRTRSGIGGGFSAIAVGLLLCYLLSGLAIFPPAAGAAPAGPREIHLSWDDPSLTDVTVTWVTDPGHENLRVRYGRTRLLAEGSAGAASSRVPNAPSLVLQQARLGPLVPGATYYYSIGNGALGWTPPRAFRAAPSGGGAVTFVAVGDMGVNPPAALNVQRMLEAKPAFALHAGDLSYANGRGPVWDAWFEEIEPLASRVPYLPAVGNHEYEGRHGLDAYLARFALPRNERWYSFTYGDLHVVSLDGGRCYGCGIPAGETAWLAADLRRNAQDPSHPWTVVVLHYPPFSSGGHGSWWEGRRLWSPLFDRYGVDLVIAGHDHDYERTWPTRASGAVEGKDYRDPRAPVYVVVGGGGMPLYGLRSQPTWSAFRSSSHASLRISVEGGAMIIEALRPDGRLLDAFTIVHGGGAPSPPTPPSTPPPKSLQGPGGPLPQGNPPGPLPVAPHRREGGRDPGPRGNTVQYGQH